MREIGAMVAQSQLQRNSHRINIMKTKQELIDEMVSSGKLLPIRDHMDDPNIKWRSDKPDYTMVNYKYLKEKSQNHPKGNICDMKLIQNFKSRCYVFLLMDFKSRKTWLIIIFHEMIFSVYWGNNEEGRWFTPS